MSTANCTAQEITYPKTLARIGSPAPVDADGLHCSFLAMGNEAEEA